MDAPTTAARAEDAHPLPLPAWLDQLAALDLTALDVDATFLHPSVLRDPASAVARGLLGERLRSHCCLTRAPTCDACPETARCDYARIFAGDVDPLALPGGARGLHPYWLRGLPADSAIPAGARFTARLVVTAFAAPVLPYLDIALREALVRLGGPSPAPPRLSSSRTAPVRLPLAVPAARLWRIEALTPLVLRGDTEACARACPAAPWLALIARVGVRRVDALLRAFSPAPPPPRVAFPRMDDVEVVSGGLSPRKISRYSRRQGRRFPLDGLVGSAVVRGEAMPALGALLAALSETGVGKATTMGFGVLAAEPLA
jgi:hypothetical protein